LDAGLHYLRTLSFSIANSLPPLIFSAFLQCFPGEQAFLTVRNLRFPTFSRDVLANGITPYFCLMQRCAHLQSLSLKFSATHLLVDWDVRRTDQRNWNTVLRSSNPEFLSCEALLKRFGLRRLFELQDLRSVEFEPWPLVEWMYHRSAGLTVDSRMLIEEVVKWMQRGFVEKGRTVSVNLWVRKAERT
jgi:hypothetical protein